MTDEMHEISFREGLPLGKGKYPGYNPRTEVTAGIICEYDVTVMMRDEIKIYIDVFRPEKEGQYPVLIGWAPYGKHGRIKY